MVIFNPALELATLAIALVGVLYFTVLTWFGLTLPVALRMGRVLLPGLCVGTSPGANTMPMA